MRFGEGVNEGSLVVEYVEKLELPAEYAHLRERPNGVAISPVSFTEFVEHGGVLSNGQCPISSRTLEVTQGNIDNCHIYVTTVVDLFPEDVFGGPNESEAASPVHVAVGGELISTDIVKEKNIFRKRGWVRKFFAETNVRAGDLILLEKFEPYLYRISKVENNRT